MYDCRLRAVDEILARLVWVTNQAPEPRDDAFFGLFQIRFTRYLCGVGHPSTTRDAVGDEAFDEDSPNPLTRARLFLFAMLESYAMPLAPDFHFTVSHLSFPSRHRLTFNADPSEQREHPSAAPLPFLLSHLRHPHRPLS